MLIKSSAAISLITMITGQRQRFSNYGHSLLWLSPCRVHDENKFKLGENETIRFRAIVGMNLHSEWFFGANFHGVSVQLVVLMDTLARGTASSLIIIDNRQPNTSQIIS